MENLLNLFYFALLCCLPVFNCQSSFPCPDPVIIMPCTCELDDATQLMTLDCSDVISTQQLQTVFSMDFPVNHFGLFRMVNLPDSPSPVDSLPDGIFVNATFDIVDIAGTQIATIGENVFEKSYDKMKSIKIRYALLNYFFFDKLSPFTKLTTILLDNNNITHMADISSTTLQYLSVPYNPNLYFSDSVFINTPNLTWLELTGIKRSVIPTDIFKTLYKLEYINFGQSDLTILQTNSFNLPSDTLLYLDFRFNNIREIQVGSIQGLRPGCDMYFTSNSISTLEEEVWRPIFEVLAESSETSQIFLIDNPLDCSCSIAWLVLNDTLRKEISQFSACAGGGPDVLDLDSRFYAANC